MRHLQRIEVHPCGYAPRVLRRWRPDSAAEPGEALFIGSKDGSVTMLRREVADRGSFTPTRLPLYSPEGEASAGVRAIQPLGLDWLIVGRNNGNIDFIKWRDALSRPPDLALQASSRRRRRTEAPSPRSGRLRNNRPSWHSTNTSTTRRIRPSAWCWRSPATESA